MFVLFCLFVMCHRKSGMCVTPSCIMPLCMFVLFVLFILFDLFVLVCLFYLFCLFCLLCTVGYHWVCVLLLHVCIHVYAYLNNDEHNTNTNKYKQIQTSSNKYREITLLNTNKQIKTKYKQLQNKYKQV